MNEVSKIMGYSIKDSTARSSITDINSELNNKVNTSDLQAVATSGSYNDLTDTPTIPTKTSDLINDSGFIDDISSKQDILTPGSNINITNNIISATDTTYTNATTTNDGLLSKEDKTKLDNGTQIKNSSAENITLPFTATTNGVISIQYALNTTGYYYITIGGLTKYTGKGHTTSGLTLDYLVRKGDVVNVTSSDCSPTIIWIPFD